MTSKKKKLSLLGASVLTAAASLSFTTSALAQDTPTAEEQSEDETVVVTGSRLRRDPVNAPTPLIQVQREAIIESGEANIIDYLADIPALQQSIVPEDTTGAGLGDGGLSLLNLRNLGSVRTLTLVDGRRHVGAGQGAPQVDIDTIPRLMIDNVEVVTGGASAIYGADAVGGVVNFILRREFEGVEFDAVYAQINQDGQYNQRGSVLWGGSGVNDRLHVYLTGEYEESEEVLDEQIDWQQDNCAILNRDTDPLAGPNPWQVASDGVLDNISLCGLRSYSRPFGSVLTIAHGTSGSAPQDPDIPNSTNRFLIDPPYSYQFSPTGSPYLIDYGTYRDENGELRTTSVGGSGDPLWRFGDSRLPSSESFRFQAGGNFDLLPRLEIFGDIKAAHETTLDNFQPAFFQVTLQGGYTGQASLSSIQAFTIGLNNAYLDPALFTAINTNVITRYGPPGYTTAQLNLANCTVLPAQVANLNPAQPGAFCQNTSDRRAEVRLFTDDLGSRPQENTRDMYRFVLGARGDFDDFLFVNDINWEVGYTRGETTDENREFETIDVQRMAFSVDAVVDTLGAVNGIPGEIVCRVQLLDDAAPGSVVDQWNGGNIPTGDERITDCEPGRLFGAGGLAQAYDYIVTSQRLTNDDQQQDFLAYASGSLWDFWGAGPIGIAAGYEWREEQYSGRFFSDPNRFLFANFIADFDEAEFDVHEIFGEINVPILSGLPFAESVEFTGAYRLSDYSTGQDTDTWSTTGTWRVSQDLRFTGTYGFSVRAPALGELFSAQSDTFLALTDNCSNPVILATTNPVIQANRIANCETVWPGIISTTYIDPLPATTNSGSTGGNPNLLPEESTSWTASMSITPRFTPNFAFRVDYYDIEITNVIAALTLQQIMNNCVDGSSPNMAACGLLERFDDNSDNFFDQGDGDGEVIDFLQSPVNYAAFRARGVDITARYFADLQAWTGHEWGSIDWSVTGSYQFQRDNSTNPTDPTDITEIDSTVGNPHVRINSRMTWSLDPISVTWELDWQSMQELFDETVLIANPDDRDPALLDTEDFFQNDFFVRWNVTDNVALRGGVINAFDAEPSIQSRVADNFDLFGRRFFIGVNFRH